LQGELAMSQYFHHEIDCLKDTMVAVGALVEDCIAQAITAILRRDVDLAHEIAAGDADINDMEVDVEAECLRLLARYHPVATDLRLVIAVLKINNDLERMADLAAAIAKRAVNLATAQAIQIPSLLEDMASASQAMVQQSLQAFQQGNAALAQQVRDADAAIDAYSRRLYALIYDQIHSDPEQSAPLMHVKNYTWQESCLLYSLVSTTIGESHSTDSIRSNRRFNTVAVSGLLRRC